MDRTLSRFFFFNSNWGRAKKPPKLHPGCVFFGSWSFIILKNSGQDQSNEWSKFILSSLEVGRWAAQTKAFFQKLPKITDFGLLQQPQNRARFWISYFDLVYWQCKYWPCSYLWHAVKKVYKDWVSLCSIIRL